MLLQFLAVVICNYAFGGLLGYVVHWAFHQSWSGRFYKVHKAHHNDMYPASDFLSDEYRSAGKNSTAPWFTAVLTAVMLPLLMGAWALGAPPWALATVVIESITIGLLNNWVHDSIHIRGHWLERFRFFKKWRTAH